MFFQKRKFIFCFILGIILFIPASSWADWSNSADFFVDSTFDLYGRDRIETQLLKTTNKFYFYVDKNWWDSLNAKNQADSIIYNLASEFEYKIYPTLTNLFGKEDTPGIDNDPRIIVVLHKMKPTIGGYIQIEDHYSNQMYPRSNMGQIIYLNADNILSLPNNILRYHLAHEFMHLITLNQKPNAETWFSELISEFAGQIIGVDSGAITKQRAQSLLYSTEINLIDWGNSDKDYAKVYLLGLYLKEQFGNQLFSEVLKYPSENGLISFIKVFEKNKIDFEQAFLNWLLTNIVNDCSLGKEYCYQDSSLQNYSVITYSYHLSTQAKSSLSVTDSIKPWSAKWQKVTGGTGMVKLKFTIPEETPINKIPYIIESVDNKKTIGFLDFSLVNIQEVYVEDMGTKNKSVYFIPFIGSLGEQGKTYYYSWEITNVETTKQQEEEIIQALLKKIEELKKQIAILQTQIAMQKTYQNSLNCTLFSQDLYYGMKSDQVKCLQQFLVNLGNDIYPEKLITGYYGPLTMAAVKRYQAFKGIITTGYFGPITRAKVNQEL